MKIHATGGTDVANIILFWPDNLPKDFEKAWEEDKGALLENLDKNGKLICFPCGGDGEFPVSIFVDLEIPPEFKEVCRDPWNQPWQYERVEVRGDGYYGGVEYIFKDKSLFKEGSLDRVKIPAGTYSVSVYEIPEYDELRKKWIRKEAGILSIGLGKLSLLSICVAAIALVLSCCLWHTYNAMLLFLSIAIAFGTLAYFLSSTRQVDRFFDAEQEAKKVFPAFVAEFISLA